MGHYQVMPPMFFVGFMATVILILIFAAPVALTGGMVAAVVYVAKKMKARKTEQAAPTAQSDSTASTRFIQEAGGYRAEYDGAYRQHVDLGVAGVDVWVYPRMQMVRRTVRIKDATLAEKFGQRMKLEDVMLEGVSVQDIVTTTTGEVRNLLSIASSAHTESVKKVDGGNVDRKARARIKAHKQEREQSQNQRQRQLKAKAKASYVGEVIRFGMEEKNGREGPYQTFCLNLLDTEAGAPHQLSGVDLERAIKDAGVTPGDKVVVENLGRTSITLGDGSTGYKNLWNVRKA